MKITLLVLGKTDANYLITGFEIYQKRLKHYVSFEMVVIPDLKGTKNLSETQQKQKEGELILSKIASADEVVLLDENGQNCSSVQFSDFLNKKMVAGIRSLVFVIGGPYGFSPEVYQRASSLLSLSSMTFSHQMVRLIFVEQVYRAFTILKGEPYHHT